MPPEWNPDDVRRLHAIYERAHRDFDTAIRVLAGGALAISIAFVHNIAKHPDHTWLLAVALVLFAAALGMNLWSFLATAARTGRWLRLMRDSQNLELTETVTIDLMNWASMFSFLGGVIFLVLFAVLNV